jgi:hypothetical protein
MKYLFCPGVNTDQPFCPRIAHIVFVQYSYFPSRYVDIGDSIALQYGGSEAHKKVTAGKSESIMPIGKVRNCWRIETSGSATILHCTQLDTNKNVYITASVLF